MNQIYGFEGEVKAKYTAQMYELFSEVFEWLPLAQCINGKVLVRMASGAPRAPSPTHPPPTGTACGQMCWWSKLENWGMAGASPHITFPTLNPRLCTEACSVKTVSPWTISGRSSGIGSPQIQVTGGLVTAPYLSGPGVHNGEEPPGLRFELLRPGGSWDVLCTLGKDSKAVLQFL